MLNNISFFTFKNNIRANKDRILNTNNKFISFSTKNNNLAPLACDTVIFSGNHGRLNHSLFEAFDNIDTCIQVRDDARPAMSYLKTTLEEALSPFVASKDNPYGSIDDIHTRIKTPDSIKEKTIDKLNAAITSPEPWAFNPNTVEGIKGAVGDIIGARIILRKSDSKQTSQIIGVLADLARQGKLKITKIENFIPVEMQPGLKYFEDSDLEKLKDAVNASETSDKPVEVKNNAKGSGYMALHLDVELSRPEYKAWNNGYRGEIQILGYDVAKLKDLEDYCYKMKSDKDIKSGHFAYKPLSDYFKSLYSNNSDYPNLEDDFETYTARAYLIQRGKEPLSPDNKKRKNTLPTIEECGLKGKIPKGLDFNILNSIRQYCDKIYEITSAT